MDVKKNPKKDLAEKRTDFFLIGLVFSVGLTLLAFSWTQYEKKVSLQNIIIEEDLMIMENTVQEVSTPPPPPQEVVIEVVEDDVEIPDDVPEINFDDIDLDTKFEKFDMNSSGDDAEDTDEIFEIFDVSELAEFKLGGEEGLIKFIAENTKYPDMAIENSIQGIINLVFVVNKDGTIGDIQVVGRELGFGLEKEAIRVIKMTSGKWKPAKQREKAVPVRYRLPYRFQLQ